MYDTSQSTLNAGIESLQTHCPPDPFAVQQRQLNRRGNLFGTPLHAIWGHRRAEDGRLCPGNSSGGSCLGSCFGGGLTATPCLPAPSLWGSFAPAAGLLYGAPLNLLEEQLELWEQVDQQDLQQAVAKLLHKGPRLEHLKEIGHPAADGTHLVSNGNATTLMQQTKFSSRAPLCL